MQGSPVPKSLPDGWLGTQSLSAGAFVRHPQTSAISIRSEVGDQIFPIPDKFIGSAEAYIVGLSIFITQFLAIPQVLSYYRWHGNNMSGGQPRRYETIALSIEYRKFIFHEQRNQLKKISSAEFANQLNLDDNIGFMDRQIWLHIFADNRPGHLEPGRLKEIESRLPKTLKYLTLRVLLRLPPAATRALEVLWKRRPYWIR